MISRMYTILRDEGIAVLFRKILYHLRLEFLLFPFACIAIRNQKSDDTKGLIEFCFNTIGGIIRPLQIKEEIAELLDVVRALNPKVMLEIGTSNGGTLFLFSQVVSKKALIISVDFPDIRFGGGYDWWKGNLFKKFKYPAQTMELIKGDSHKVETLDKVKRILNGLEVDFIFIDGDHSYEGVKEDFMMYSPLLRNGGMIAFHDIVVHPIETGCEVNRFWKEVINMPHHIKFEIIHDLNQISSGIGIIFKDRRYR